jgi:hypothetical protein
VEHDRPAGQLAELQGRNEGPVLHADLTDQCRTTTPSRGAPVTAPPRRRHLPTSPFAPEPEPVIEVYDVGDVVTHDTYGMGRVVGVEAAAVAVDFGSRTVRIPSPYAAMSLL